MIHHSRMLKVHKQIVIERLLHVGMLLCKKHNVAENA